MVEAKEKEGHSYHMLQALPELRTAHVIGCPRQPATLTLARTPTCLCHCSPGRRVGDVMRGHTVLHHHPRKFKFEPPAR